MDNDSVNIWVGLIIALVLLFFAVSKSVPYLIFWDEVKGQVVKSERRYISGDSGDRRHLVYLENETLQNVDAYTAMKFNSSDLYGKIEEGRCYRFGVHGVRIGFFSMWRNIHRVEEVECK